MKKFLTVLTSLVMIFGFASIVKAVEEARVVYDNTKKITK